MGSYHMARMKAAYEYLKERDVKLVCIETATSKSSLVKEAEFEETPYERVTLFPGRVFDELRPAEMDQAVRKALYRIKPDAVATNSYFLPDTRSALRWCRGNRKAAITMIDSKEDDAKRAWWREAMKSIIVRQYNAALVAGKPHRSYMRKLGIADDTIFDGLDVVDNEFFANMAQEARSDPDAFSHLPGLREGAPYFLVSSRFIPRKNLERLFSVYARYRRQNPQPWRLVILGDGRLKADLEAQVAREEIDGVTFAGLRTLKEVSAYYAFAGALIHPAIADQWALVVNEAMATGLPVIVSTGAGCAYDLVEPPKNGYQFEPEDSEALLEAMSKMSAPGTDREAMGRESLRIIGEWPPERFASGLYNATMKGLVTSNRGLGLLPRSVLWLMLRMSRAPASFGSVES